MARVLVNLYRGLPPWHHLSGRSMFGGANQTEFAHRRRPRTRGRPHPIIEEKLMSQFRRVATRYDKLARNYLSTLAIATIVTYWI
jgi:hypothetical protein